MRTSASFLAAMSLCLGTAFGQSASQPTSNAKTFDTPDAAAAALIHAAEKGDTGALADLFGPGAKSFLSSGDTKQDQQEREEFASLAHAKMQIEPDPMNHDRVILVVGTEDWPFPVPIVRTNGQWHFDASQGREEIRARRVGANELNVVEICAGYVEAQQEFSQRNREWHAYADRIMSSPGKDDGLYSETKTSNGQPLVPVRFAQAAVDHPGAVAPAKPYHGYYYRILKAQGPDAPGGSHSYIVKTSVRRGPSSEGADGKAIPKVAPVTRAELMGGFGLIAWPADYGVSGVHTFIVNQDGVIFEKDLGSSAAANQITTFNPDRTWTRVQ
jgi:hypothetical protein